MLDELVEHANIIDVEELVLMCISNELDVKHANTWYLDIGCSNHMCGKKEFFLHLDEFIRGEVNFRNKSKILIISKGDINIQSKDDTNATIFYVYFVLGLFWYLLSIDKLSKKRNKMDI